MSKKMLYRALTPEVRVIDEAAGIVEYVASDETLDCYCEIIVASGWRFDLFRKNAPFVDTHDYYSIDKLLGSVLEGRVEGKQLIERVQWAKDVPENKLARVGWQMTLAGHLKAVSVGFFPEKTLRRGEEGWAEEVTAHGLDPAEASAAWRIFTQQQQTELSSVILGANPNALLKAFEDQAIDEADLYGIGFGGDDEFEFLQKARSAEQSPQCDAAFRTMLKIEMQRIYKARPDTSGGKRISRGSGQTNNGSDGRGDAAAETERRRWYEHFLRKLDDLAR